MDPLSKVLIAWQDGYSLKIESIDHQHQALVTMIRQLQEAMLEGRGREVQEELIKKLVVYVEYHFQFEEQLMSEYGYEGLIEHRHRHRELSNQVLDLQRRLSCGEAVSNGEVLRFLRHWLTDHILKVDKKFGEVYETKSNGSSVDSDGGGHNNDESWAQLPRDQKLDCLAEDLVRRLQQREDLRQALDPTLHRTEEERKTAFHAILKDTLEKMMNDNLEIFARIKDDSHFGACFEEMLHRKIAI